jgi:hypothetical protein
VKTFSDNPLINNGRGIKNHSNPRRRVNQDDHITEADYVIADADDEVREVAASYLGGASAVEVWHRARCIVRVSADKPATSRPDG